MKTNLFGSDGITSVWRKVNLGNDYANTIPIAKHGRGSTIIWGSMSVRGMCNIHFIDGMMDKYVYNDILKKNIQVPSRWEGLYVPTGQR